MPMWIDLRDPAGARLRALAHQGRRFLVLEGISPQSKVFRRAIDELAFTSSRNGAYLLKPFGTGDTIAATTFRGIWPNAIARDMPLAAFMIALKQPQSNAVQRQDAGDDADRLREIQQTLQESDYLGRNSSGHRVFAGRAGRFIATDAEALLYESDAGRGNPAMFLRASDAEELVECASGFIRAIEMGEVQRDGDLQRFIAAVLPEGGDSAQALSSQVRRALEEAKYRYLQGRYETPVEAWGDSIRLTEFMAAEPREGEQAWLPLPLALSISQALGLHQVAPTPEQPAEQPPRRLFLGGDVVGGGALMVPSGIGIEVPPDAVDNALAAVRSRLAPAEDAGLPYDFMVVQAPWSEDQQDGDQLLRELLPNVRSVRAGGGIAMVVPLANGARAAALSPQQRETLEGLRSTADVEAIFDVPSALSRSSGLKHGARLVIAAPLVPGQRAQPLPAPKACHSWDDLKTVVDELLVSRGQRPSTDEVVRISERTLENDLQRPYVAYSRVGDASTMVPKNLQSSLNYALARIEEEHGPIDEYVAYELGMGQETLADRFSAEQVDGIGLLVSRLQKGRGVIVGDDTGIGKGRQLAAAAVWANKQGRTVVFVTDRANLFSDLARDLIDIDEWGRFRPMPMNSDGHVLDIMADNEVLVSATPAERMNAILEQDLSWGELGVNLVFLTYSQVSRQDSPKAAWLLKQSSDALVILDEAHIAAGADSNSADYIRVLTERAWGVVYASATWAKSARNLHTYVRAFPESVNISQVGAAMKRGGEEFAEVFSSMLARDGAFYRREHDLSKLEANVLVDDQHYERNRALMNQVSEVLGMMSLLSGEVNQLLHRANTATRGAMRAAQEARDAWVERARVNMAAIDDRIRQLESTDRREELEAAKAERRDLEAQIGRPIAKGNFFQSSFGTGGVLYQAMRRTISALLADFSVERALTAIEAGRRPVIVFDDTGEALIRRFIEEEQERIQAAIAARESDVGLQALADELSSRRRTAAQTEIRMPMLKDLMHAFLQRLGGVKVQQGEDPEGGGTGESTQISIAALPGVSPAQVDAYRRGVEAILARIEALPDLPISPADYIRVRLEEAGHLVGEISGRQFELRRPDGGDEANNQPRGFGGLWRVVKRARKKTDVMSVVRAFNAGRIDAILMNRAAATGTSMHASPRFLNQDRRELIEYQIPEDPTVRLQLYGRVNRFDQVVGPMVSMVTTGLRSELRNLMMQNRKLAGLSVNVRSSRENAALFDDVPDMLNSVGDEVCEEYLLENPGVMSRLSIEVARVQDRTGLANLVTQRIALLQPDDQDKVYDDLFAAYDDAVIRRELAGEGAASMRNRDWRARTVSEEQAWGPSGEIPQDLFSAFDGPVFLRTVEYVKDYQPISWEALKETIGESNATLVGEGKASFAPLQATVSGRAMVVADYSAELSESVATRRARQATEVVSQFAQAAAAAAGGDGATATRAEAGQGATAEWRSVLAGVWVPVRIRRGGDNVYDRFIAYVPRRAPYIPMWQLNGDSGGELRLHFPDGGQPALQVVGRRSPQGATWAEMFRKAYLPSDERLRQVSISPVIENAGLILEGKRIIALQRSELATVEEALAQPGHNAVKEAHWRLLFLRSVMAKLVPGAELTLRELTGTNSISFWTGGDTMTVAKVDIPQSQDAAVFSKWKYHLVRPGDEKPTVLTAASLFKRAGQAPDFDLVDVAKGHLFDFDSRGDAARLERRFGDHVAGPVTMRRKLLTGNLFQAAEWAEATKAGMAITYTDETGQRHRAIHVRASAFGRQDIDLHRLPIRLHNPLMISDFISRTLDWANTVPAAQRASERTLSVPMSFKAAMQDGERRQQSLTDFFGISPFTGGGHASIAFGVEKREKARFVRVIKAVMDADKRDWEAEHPDETYPLTLHAQAARTAREQEDTVVMLQLPQGREARTRFIDLIIRAVGLQLYVRPQDLKLAELARQSEAFYFQEVADRIAPERQRLLDEQATRRERNRQLVGDSFDSGETESSSGEDAEQETDGQQSLGLSPPAAPRASAPAM